MTALLLAALLGCGGSSDAPVALPDAEADPAGALTACGQLAYEEMRVLCRIEAASAAGRAGLLDTVERACAEIPEGTWQHECHFRAGEELARGGHAVPAVEHCARAGRFSRFCITHAAWALPPAPWMTEELEGPALAQALGAQHGELAQAAQGLEAAVRTEATDTFGMRLWFNAYYGTGTADPAAARSAAQGQGPAARSAFMMEAARLLAPHTQGPGHEPVQRLLACWQDEACVLQGDPMPVQGRHGRYAVPIPVPQEKALERLPLYGGGRRIVGRDAEEDLVIAALEALWFRPDTPAEPFLPWVDDPRERVRWTAARLLRLTPPETLDMQATLEELARHADQGVAWNARDGLEHRSWETKPGGPR